VKASVLAAVIALAPAAGRAQHAGPARTAEPAGARPAILNEIGYDQRLGETVPRDIVLRDESGREVRFGDFLGRKPVVLTLVYYECPMLCTLTLNGLAGALKTLAFDIGREFDVVTVSFDPRETPALAAAKKKAYLARYDRPGAEAGWHFLTGDAAQIARLTGAVGFRYAWDERTRQFAHPSGVVLLAPDGTIARYLYGIEYAPKDLRMGLMEASERRIGTAVDHALLYCYQYDPATGRYGMLTMRLIRGGGVLTVLGLGGFIFAMRRRELATLRAQAG
jgi:protein SCO1/2